MIETISFWLVPFGSLKKRIRKCNCGKRLNTKATECKECHKKRESFRRKKSNYKKWHTVK